MKRLIILTAILFSLTTANAQIGELKAWFNKKKTELKEKVNQKINETADKIMNKTVSMSDSVKLNKKKKRKNKKNAEEIVPVEEISAPQQDTSFQSASSPVLKGFNTGATVQSNIYNEAVLIYPLRKTISRHDIITT